MQKFPKQSADAPDPPAGPAFRLVPRIAPHNVAPKTKEHQVAELLREGIIAGSFVRGQRLKQAEIAKQLGISITPVREALRLLEAEGYVRVSSHRGAVVAPFQLDCADELYSLRLTLEGKLAAVAAQRLTPQELDQLSAIHRQIIEATANGDREGIRGGNFRFHFRLYELAGLPHTLEFVRVLWAKYPFDLLGAILDRPKLVLIEHTAILDALCDRDPRAATRAMSAHITSGHRQFNATYAIHVPR